MKFQTIHHSYLIRQHCLRGDMTAAFVIHRHHVEPDAASKAEWCEKFCLLAWCKLFSSTTRTLGASVCILLGPNFSVGNQWDIALLHFSAEVVHPTAHHRFSPPSTACRNSKLGTIRKTTDAHYRYNAQRCGGRSVVCSRIQHLTSRAPLLVVASSVAASNLEVYV